jgi:hypothetical protein
MDRYYDSGGVFILMVVWPPQFGLAIGIILGLARRQLGAVRLGYLAGATLGACLGLILYFSVVLAHVSEPKIFQECVLVVLLLGAIPVGWYLVSSPAAAENAKGTKPTTLWAGASLVCSILGYVNAIALLVVASYPKRDTTGVALGVAILFLGFPAATLWLLGAVFGVVALVRIRNRKSGGRGTALTGVFLGCLPLLFAVLSFLNPFR